MAYMDEFFSDPTESRLMFVDTLQVHKNNYYWQLWLLVTYFNI